MAVFDPGSWHRPSRTGAGRAKATIKDKDRDLIR